MSMFQARTRPFKRRKDNELPNVFVSQNHILISLLVLLFLPNTTKNTREEQRIPSHPSTMSSRYPKRKRAAIDYAAIASGNTQAPRTSKTGKAQALRLPKSKRPATSPSPPKLSKSSSKAANPARASKTPKAPKVKAAVKAIKAPKRPVVERPEPEPLDQNSDGGPDPPSPDPEIDPEQLSATTATRTSYATTTTPSTEFVPQYEQQQQQPTPVSIQPKPGPRPRSIFDPDPDVDQLFRMMDQQEQDLAFLDMDTDPEPFPDLINDSSSSSIFYQPRTNPLTELSVQEVVDFVGTVIYFVRAVKRIRIDVANPLSVTRALDARDRVWDDPARDWAKYGDRAWRHRFHVADGLYEMPLGHVAALVDVVMRFKEDLDDKGIHIGL
ncbi:uncharacterized protein F4807DRAFT_467659 [Annulohypoxylon truncatum]|uniref:uncharacterized protein n=1 Tax=Annulohypoxylon truncatum TaxID=327061 RepID=UPI002008B59F|nr:uncharacterized protein F4807DRAFT_467659 [Annulohypoxylon truncatum]KAI1209401.1 hypothetical protein F4807DRAFT_467659 [Annulohypoxylon truncatum]